MKLPSNINKSPLRTKVREIESNLLTVYSQATAAEAAEGRQWYRSAYAQMLAWSKFYGPSVETVAAMTAAISPQCDWPTNLKIAEQLLMGIPTVGGGAIRRNVDIARRILIAEATDVRDYFADAPKVEAFAANLAGDFHRVTVDTHGGQAGLNDPQAVLYLSRPKFDIFADCYTTVAYEVGELPADFQAVCWVVWKRLYPAVAKRRLRKVWSDEYAA
jgi:hypothetical protein